jgi:hypothetical protein
MSRPYEVTIKSNAAVYQVPVYAEDSINAAFAAGQQVTNYPAWYPRAKASPNFTVVDVVNIENGDSDE